MINRHNRYYVKILSLCLLKIYSVMKIRVFPNHGNRYDFVEYEIDELELETTRPLSEYDELPSLFLDDVIDDLISKN